MGLPVGVTGLGTRTVGKAKEKDHFETMGAAVQISWFATYFAG
jgi:hypothetical protein